MLGSSKFDQISEEFKLLVLFFRTLEVVTDSLHILTDFKLFRIFVFKYDHIFHFIMVKTPVQLKTINSINLLFYVFAVLECANSTLSKSHCV